MGTVDEDRVKLPFHERMLPFPMHVQILVKRYHFSRKCGLGYYAMWLPG